MGFGIVSPQPQPVQTNNLAGIGGFNFGGPSAPVIQPQSAPVNSPQNNFGFNLLGSGPTVPASQPAANQLQGFQPITNTNPNKILAYENQHLQIWMDCIKEGPNATKLFTTYINKTNNTLTELTIQAAVLKHVKLTINSLSSTTLQPYSR